MYLRNLPRQRILYEGEAWIRAEYFPVNTSTDVFAREHTVIHAVSHTGK